MTPCLHRVLQENRSLAQCGAIALPMRNSLLCRDSMPAAIEALKADLQSANADRLQLLAFCSFYTADFRTTSRAAQQLKEDPRHAGPGSVLGKQGRPESGRSEPWRARAKSTRIRHTCMCCSETCSGEKRHWDEAEAEYRKAIALDPKSHSARLELSHHSVLRVEE